MVLPLNAVMLPSLNDVYRSLHPPIATPRRSKVIGTSAVTFFMQYLRLASHLHHFQHEASPVSFPFSFGVIAAVVRRTLAASQDYLQR